MANSAPNVCGYELVRWLSDQRTGLCRAENGRLLVLKRLGDDCLLDGQLHPDIRDRLAHIREMAHAQVATLISVERDRDGAAWTVRQYVEGADFEAWVCDNSRDERQAARMLRELVLAVESLNDMGIVHGQLSTSNVIVDAQGKLHLLDLSPLLFQDESKDVSAICSMYQRILACRRNSPIGRAILPHLTCNQPRLRDLSSALSRALQTSEAASSQLPAADDERQLRKQAMRWVMLACVVTLLAAIVGAWIFSATRVKAPEAPPEAMKER